MHSLFFDRKFGKKFSKTNQIDGNITSCNNKGYGRNNHEYPASQSHRKRFSEDGYTKKNGSQGFQSPQNGRRRRTDVLDGLSSTKKRNSCRKNSQGDQITPQIPGIDNPQTHPEIYIF